MIAQTRRLRAMLIVVSAASYVLSLSDLSNPLDARDLPATPAPTRRTIDRPTAPPLSVYVRRDPFAGAPESETAADDVLQDGSAALGTRSIVANTPKGADDADGTVVPDIATDGAGVAADANAGVEASSFIVRATIAGAHPVAYVAQGSDLQLVRVGDSVAGRRVVAIDLRGLALSDGTRLDLVESYLATPAPRARGGSRIDAAIAEIRRLRAELEARVGHDGVPVPLAGRPSPTDMPAFATTPGPLPTVDTRGLPVGVNPTPDAGGPTAFPYPYPYAPASH
jgi:hypothetical protein